MEKFCCEKFKSRFEIPRDIGLNIRVLKLSGINASKEDKSVDQYGIFLTEGFSIGQKGVKRILIKYCPFCGKELSKYYYSNSFVNEEVDNLISY